MHKPWECGRTPLKFHLVQILFKQEEASANPSGRVRKAPMGIFCDTCLMYLKDEATRIAIAGLLIVVQSSINCLIVFGGFSSGDSNYKSAEGFMRVADSASQSTGIPLGQSADLISLFSYALVKQFRNPAPSAQVGPSSTPPVLKSQRHGSGFSPARMLSRKERAQAAFPALVKQVCQGFTEVGTGQHWAHPV